MLKSFRWISQVFLCGVLFYLGQLGFPTLSTGTDFSGEWQGSYTSTWDNELSGTLRGVFTQNGNQLTGKVDITDSGCTPEYDIPIYDGSANGDTAQFKADMNCYDPETGFSGSVTTQFIGNKSSGPFAGTYSAWVKQDPGDVLDGGTFSMTRSALEVTSDFTANVTSGPAPLTVNFTNISQGQYSTSSWSFGDGGTSNLENPSHVYNNPGSYTVSLTVSGVGGTDTKTRTNYITVGQPSPAPVALFTGNPTSGWRPLMVTFTDESTGATSWSWTFTGANPSSFIGRNPPIVIYNSSGKFTVSLTVVGPGGSDTLTRTDYISVQESWPVPDFSAEPLSGTAPLSVQFADLSTGKIDSRYWIFGDGQTSTAANPQHVYQNVGKYDVTLRVSSIINNIIVVREEKKIQYIDVKTPPPAAKFSMTPFHGPVPLDVQFTDQSSGDITSRAWSFGDGSTAGNELSPLHTYSAIGVYPVALNVTGPGGSSTATGSVMVYQIVYVDRNDASCGGKTPCRTTLQAAVNDAAAVSLIKVTQGGYPEDVLVAPAQSKVIMCQGGYNSAFTAMASGTTVNQLIIGGSGTVIAENMYVQGGAIAAAVLPLLERDISTSESAEAEAGNEENGNNNGEPSEVDDFSRSIDGRGFKSPRQQVEIFSSGSEPQSLPEAIRQIHLAAFHREPHSDELERWGDYIARLIEAYDIDPRYALWVVASVIFSSDEYTARSDENEATVRVASCFRAILWREPTGEENAFWTMNPENNELLLFALLSSPEFEKKSINELKGMGGNPARNSIVGIFIGLLDRFPSLSELSAWESVPFSDVVRNILYSDELREKNRSDEANQLRLFLVEGNVRLWMQAR